MLQMIILSPYQIFIENLKESVWSHKVATTVIYSINTFAISDFELETLYFIQQNQYPLCLLFHKADSLSFGAI